MTTYYVSPSGSDSAAGSTGSPWKTLAKAVRTIAPGDTVRVRAGTYNEAITIKTKNATFMADDPDDRPVLDGLYHSGLMSTNELAMNTRIPSAATGYLGLGGNKPLIGIAAEGVVLDGFIAQNSAGKGIAIGKSNVTVRNCVTYWTFDTGIQSNPSKPISGLLIEDNEVLYASIMIFEPKRRDYTSCKKDGQCVNGAMKFGRNNGNTIIRRNRVAYGFGEGINIGKYNDTGSAANIIVEDNIVHDCNHTHIYVNATRGVDIHGNIVYCGGAYVNTWGNGAPAGIRLKDEKLQYLDSVTIYNNLIVGVGMPIAIGERDTAVSKFYCGYNTVVGGPDAAIKNNAAITVKRGERNGGAQKGIVENNLVDYSMMGQATGFSNNDAGAVAYRNNAWSSQPPAAMRSNSDVVGNLKLVNPRVKLVTKDYMTKAQNTYALFKTSNNFNADNYRLTKESAAVGAASDRTRFNNVTPPSFTTDLNGDTRTDADRANGRYWDIGAMEYGGAVTPPPVDDDVTAAFTQSGTGGVAPYTVTFTDTSTTAGSASINHREWFPGSGTAITTSQTTLQYTYTEPGTYTPKLVVRDMTRNLSSEKTGTPIVVTSPPIGEGAGIFDVVRVKIPAGGGDFTLNFDLNGYAPEFIMPMLARTTVVNNLATDAHLSIGMATPGAQRCHVINSDDGSDPTTTYTYTTAQAVAALMQDGVITGEARVVSYGGNRVTLNADAALGSYLLVCVAIGGSQFRATVGDFQLGADGETTTLALDGTPELYLFSGGNVATLESVETTADVSFGMADPDTQIGFSWRDVEGADTTRIKASVSTAAAVRAGFNKAYGVLTDFAHGGVTVMGGPDIRRKMLYAALEMPGAAGGVVKQFESPTATGEQSYSFGFKPVGAIILATTLEVYDAHNASPAAEGFSIIAIDPAGTHCVGIASEHGAGATNGHNRVSDSLHVMAGDGTAALAGAVSLVDDGIKIDWTTVQATARAFNVVAFRATAAVTGPMPMFEVDTTAPTDGTVNFTDLSNANGAAITAWEWDFGDGGTSAEQHPTHTYSDYGEYTVSLTVTNANGSETLQRAKLIRYAGQGTQWLGVYEPMTITNYSPNALYGDDPDHPNYGRISHALDLDAIVVDAYPEDTDAAIAGKVRIVPDLENSRLIVILPDGTKEYVSFD